MAPPTIGTTPELITGGDANHPKSYKFVTGVNDTTVLGSFTGKLPAKDETILGKFIGEFLNDYSGVDASQANLQATNLMLSQNMWKEYLNTTKADLAFGGPTLALFQASYNDTCRIANELGIQKSETGYQVRKGKEIFRDNATDLGSTTTQNGIYFKGSSSGSANGLRLASPGNNVDSYLMASYYEGRLATAATWNHSCGFRPIVSLRVDTQFTDNGNNTYTIK